MPNETIIIRICEKADIAKLEETIPSPGISAIHNCRFNQQTEGKGVKVYTHGEMLPAHMYPELHKHKHLAGHFGGAWQKQRAEFESFGGPIIATTKCVLIPHPSANGYAGRLYTMRMTAVFGSRLPVGSSATTIF